MFHKFAAATVIIMVLALLFAMATIATVNAGEVATINASMRIDSLPYGVTVAVKSQPKWVKVPGHVASKITGGYLYNDIAVDPAMLRSYANRQVIIAVLNKQDRLDLILLKQLETIAGD